MATLFQYVPNRVIDQNGIADGAQIFFYAGGTTTPITIYAEEAAQTELPNPLEIAAGAEVPQVYWTVTGDVRVRVVATDGTVPFDVDPYQGLLGVNVTSELSGGAVVTEADDADQFVIMRNGVITLIDAADLSDYFGSTTPPNPSPSISAVAADGWQTTVASPTDLSLSTFAVTRQGFDATGAATTIADTLTLTKRVRQDFPNQASFTTDQVAVSEPICSADTISGVNNNSSLVSPKPICAWTMPHRKLVQSSVDWSLSAFHWAARGGKQVACVRVRANDGTTQTTWQTVTDTTIDTQVEGPNSTALYRGTIDVTGLADGGFWLEAEVYPHVGVAASVLRSDDNHTAGVDPREFTRRYFRKGAIPAWAAVSSAGDDGTGAVSTADEATALANPYLTWTAALLDMENTVGDTQGGLDGCRIVIVDEIDSGSALFEGAYEQDIAGLVTTKATGSTRASAIMNWTANLAPDFENHSLIDEGSLIFEDMTVRPKTRSSTQTTEGGTPIPLNVQVVNATIDCEGLNTDMRGTGCSMEMYGVSIINMPASGSHPLTPIATIGDQDIRAMRGVTVDLGGLSYEGYITVGCQLTAPNTPTIKDAGADGHTWFNNSILDCGGTGAPISFRPGSAFADIAVGSLAIVQNLVEWTSATSGPSIAVSATNDNGDLQHCVVHHNTVAGVEDHGRYNLFYDETTGSLRDPIFCSAKGNLGPQFNTKGMVFKADAQFNGNENFVHGLSCSGNYTRDASNGFAQAYAGLGSVIDGGAINFTSNQAVTGTTASPVAGAGGGTYTLQAGSPAENIQPVQLLQFDIAGTARPSGAQDAGAYS